jgi:hypothetical protein
MTAHELDYDDLPAGYFDEEEHCDHDEYETDIVEGRATCVLCGHSWWQTKEEIDAEIERQNAYWEWARDQERPWYRFKQWLLGLLPAMKWPGVRTRAVDDEIPF